MTNYIVCLFIILPISIILFLSATPPSTASLWQDTAASEALYRLLVAPFEEYLPQTSCGHRSFGPGDYFKIIFTEN